MNIERKPKDEFDIIITLTSDEARQLYQELMRNINIGHVSYAYSNAIADMIYKECIK